jgi:glucosylglycerate synthase
LEVDSISQSATLSIDQIGSADLLVGLLADLDEGDLASTCDTLRALPGAPRIVILQNHAAPQPPPAAPNASDMPARDSSLFLVPWSQRNLGAAATPVESVSTAYESIFEAGAKLDVRAFCLVTSKLENAEPGWVSRLAQPLLEGFDFVAPCYARRRFEGLLNNSIVSPLTRSLYGKRIQNPMGPDLGISRRLYQDVLSADQDAATAGNGMHLLARLAPAACSDDFRVCQAYLGSRTYPPADWTGVSSLLTEILGPIFVAMEKNAARWQQTRNSSPVTILNESTPPVSQSTETLEIARLVDSFQLGMRDLREIWGLVLPPATLFELQKVSPEKFRIPDELWARIIYDFALAHRLRTINRSHLLRSLAPLYLGWVASYAREFENADPKALARRLERLSLAYEAGKPYLISRWRWPDRFNP